MPVPQPPAHPARTAAQARLRHLMLKSPPGRWLPAQARPLAVPWLQAAPQAQSPELGSPLSRALKTPELHPVSSPERSALPLSRALKMPAQT